MAEVERQEIEQVDHENHLGNNESSLDEVVSPKEVEHVVDGEMWSDQCQNIGLLVGVNTGVVQGLDDEECLKQ